MELRYAEIEEFIAKIHNVNEEKRIALKGRLKHFQRLGWPEGTNQGKGSRVRYGVGQALSLALGFEMLQLGLTPERIAAFFLTTRSGFPAGCIAALDDVMSDGNDELFYIFQPDYLRYLGKITEDSETFITSAVISKSKLSKEFALNGRIFNRRIALINITTILKLFVQYLAIKDEVQYVDLVVSLKKWESDENDKLLPNSMPVLAA
jgi:hypothetical protein